jgi:hypothetical protein
MLTHAVQGVTLGAMKLARTIFSLSLLIALAAYALDCGPMIAPQQAMDCCNSMPCSSQGHHGEDCCKSMAAMHAPMGQPSPVQGTSFSPVALEAISTFEIQTLANFSGARRVWNSHAPPISDPPASLILRI